MKRILIILLVLIVLVGTGWLALTQFIINPDKLAESFSAGLKQATGQEVTVNPKNAEVSLWPLPRVTYTGFAVEGLLRADAVTVKLDALALLTISAEAGEVVLHKPVLELKTEQDGTRNWQLAKGGNNADAFVRFYQSVPIVVEDGTLHHDNAATGGETTVERINGTLRYEEEGSLYGFAGTVGMSGGDARLMVRTQRVDLTRPDVSETPLQFVFDHGGVKLNGAGMLKDASTAPSFTGELELDADHIWAVPVLLTGQANPDAGDLADSPNLTGKGKLTFDLSGAVLQDFIFEAVEDGAEPIIEGGMELKYRFGQLPVFDLHPALVTLNLDRMLATQEAWLEQRDAAGQKPDGSLDTSKDEDAPAAADPWRRFLHSITGEFQVEAEQVIWRGRYMEDVAFDGGISEGVLIVNNASGLFPGNTEMTLTGQTQRQKDGLWFSGRLKLEGESLESFASVLAPPNVVLPKADLGSFLLNTNIAYNPEQFRLSEMQLRVNRTRAAGALIVHLKERLAVESFIRAHNVQLDNLGGIIVHFFPDVAEQAVTTDEEGKERLFEAQRENPRFNWMARLGADVKADFILDDFVLWDRKGGLAEFRFTAERGMASLSKVKARYNGADIAGNFSIRLEAGKNPYVTINGSASEFNMVDLIPELARTHNDDEWQTFLDKDLEFLPLRLYRGKLDAKIGMFRVKHFEFKDVKAKMHLENAELDIEDFSGSLWDGLVRARAKVQAGTIPTLSTSFALGNANLVKFSKATPLLQHAAGVAGVRGQASTSGMTLRSWLTNGTGSLSLVARDISISGFGLSTLVRAVPVARAVADLENAKKVALRGGVARFNEISGQMSIQDGEVFMPRMAVKSEEMTGTVNGTIDLINEIVDLTMEFYLNATVDNGQAPNIALVVSGPIDNLKKELQTQELDAYVARKAAERALRTTR